MASGDGSGTVRHLLRGRVGAGCTGEVGTIEEDSDAAAEVGAATKTRRKLGSAASQFYW